MNILAPNLEGLDASTLAMVAAARRRGIPVQRAAAHSPLLLLGWGRFQRRVQATVTSNTNRLAAEIAADRQLTRALLLEEGLPVPAGERVGTPDEAVAAARRLGAPVLIRPAAAGCGGGVPGALGADDEVRAAFERARRHGAGAIVERFVEGDDHRVIVVAGEVLAAARHRPPEVAGDGLRTVLELVADANADPRRMPAPGAPFMPIPVGEPMQEMLARQGLTLGAVPPAGMCVRLRADTRPDSGGAVDDVTARVHPEIAAACVRAAAKIGLDVAGIGLICRDIGRPLEEQGGAIVAVSSDPGVRLHEAAARGERRAVSEAILATLFAEGHDGRVPLIAIVGDRGRAGASRIVSAALQRMGMLTGVAGAGGIRIGDRTLRCADPGAPAAARAVLCSPQVEAAVLELPAAAAENPGFDRCTVAIVLDVEGGSHERAVRAARLVADSASAAVVLNAGDARCAAIAAHLDCARQLVYFAAREANPALVEHLGRGGRAVFPRKGTIMLAEGGRRIPLVDLHRLGEAHAARDEPVLAALAGAAALWACGFPPRRVGEALSRPQPALHA